MKPFQLVKVIHLPHNGISFTIFVTISWCDWMIWCTDVEIKAVLQCDGCFLWQCPILILATNCGCVCEQTIDDVFIILR